MEHKNVPDVSVIIPVYNQADSLRIVLEFFKYQTYPHDRYEILLC
jgi:glycosyltransferase involved in cell wall biosynthesis